MTGETGVFYREPGAHFAPVVAAAQCQELIGGRLGSQMSGAAFDAAGAGKYFH